MGGGLGNQNATGGRKTMLTKVCIYLSQWAYCRNTALDRIEQKFGQKQGMNIDSQRMRGANESIVSETVYQ
jgi:hypothetical protein